MAQGSPKVSIIIPTYNRASVLSRAVKSVLAQTFKDFELLIVDDGSTDNTKAMIANFEDKRIQFLQHPTNKGGAAARNTGIKKARGEFVALLDSDDEWLAEKLSKQIKVLENLPADVWGAVYCGLFYVDGIHSWPHEAVQIGNLTKELFSKEVNISAGSTLMIRRSILQGLNFFDESYIRHQDIELLIRFFKKYQLHSVKEPLVRIFGHNMPSADKAVSIKEKFLLEFKNDIERFDSISVRKIYAKHWYEIAALYAREGRVGLALKYLWRSSVFKVLSIREYWRFLKTLINGVRVLKK